jgi:chemotaxis protein CheX
MIGEKYDEMNEEVADCVGELTNMISGDARSQLQKVGFDFTAAIPTVFYDIMARRSSGSIFCPC